jgi:hypothetical protein
MSIHLTHLFFFRCICKHVCVHWAQPEVRVHWAQPEVRVHWAQPKT